MYHESQRIVRNKCSERASCVCVLTLNQFGFVIHPQARLSLRFSFNRRESPSCGFVLMTRHVERSLNRSVPLDSRKVRT